MCCLCFYIRSTLHPLLHNKIYVLLQDGPHHQWQRSEQQVIQRDIEIIIKRLARIPTKEGKQVLRNSKNHVLVEEVENHFTNPDVVPAAMDE